MGQQLLLPATSRVRGERFDRASCPDGQRAAKSVHLGRDSRATSSISIIDRAAAVRNAACGCLTPTGAPKPGRTWQPSATRRRRKRRQSARDAAVALQLGPASHTFGRVVPRAWLGPCMTDVRSPRRRLRDEGRGLAPLPASRATTTTPSGTRVTRTAATRPEPLPAGAAEPSRSGPKSTPPSRDGIHAGRRRSSTSCATGSRRCASVVIQGEGTRSRRRTSSADAGWPRGRGHSFA